MKISVIIPNFEDIRIIRALNSVQSQIYKNYEIIVIHGGRVTKEIEEIYSKVKIDKLLIERDEGIFDALNKGVHLATGDVIYLMGSDDYLSDNEVFLSVVDKLNKSSQLNGVCIGCEFVSSNGRVIRKWYPRSVSSRKIKWGIFPPHFSLFLKKEVYNEVGNFQFEKYRNVACDIFWLLDFAIRFPNMYIGIIKRHNLFMEYGGASTKSIEAIRKQFVYVHDYSKTIKDKLPVWFLLSPIRTFSKIFQFKFL